MYKKNRNKQLAFEHFDQPLGLKLNPENRWVKKAETIPWDAIEERYAQLFPSNRGVPAKPLRMAFGSLLLQKHLGCSDRELVEQITENPYFQYFIGLPGYQMEAPYVPSLLVEFRLTRSTGNERTSLTASCAVSVFQVWLLEDRRKTQELTKRSNTGMPLIELKSRAFSLAKRSFGLGLITTKLETTTRSSIVLSIIAMNVDRLTKEVMRFLLSIFQGTYAGLSFEQLSKSNLLSRY